MLAFWGGGTGSIGTFVPPPVNPRPFGAGVAGRKRRKYLIEIDGEQFVVNSEYEAQALIEQVNALAKQEAQAVAKTALNKARKVKRKTGVMPTLEIAVPEIRVLEGDDDLSALIAAGQQALDEIYLRAAQAAEIAWLAHRAAYEQDEEDVVILLLNS